MRCAARKALKCSQPAACDGLSDTLSVSVRGHAEQPSTCSRLPQPCRLAYPGFLRTATRLRPANQLSRERALC